VKSPQEIANSEPNRLRRRAGRLQMLALEMPMHVVVGAVMGMWLDRTFATTWWVWVGVIVGTVGACRAIARIIAAYKDTP
jgi:F0F1-type ATP synthase assembly protein I